MDESVLEIRAGVMKFLMVEETMEICMVVSKLFPIYLIRLKSEDFRLAIMLINCVKQGY